MGNAANSPPSSTPSGKIHGVARMTRIAASVGPAAASTGAAVACWRSEARAVRWVATAASTISGTATSTTSIRSTWPPKESSSSCGMRIQAESGAPNSRASRNDRTCAGPNT